MIITGLPSKRISKHDASLLELEFANNGMACFWNEDGELVVMADYPDTSLDKVMRAKGDDFNWVLQKIFSRLIPA